MGIPDKVNKLLLQFTVYVVDTAFSVTRINSEAHVTTEKQEILSLAVIELQIVRRVVRKNSQPSLKTSKTTKEPRDYSHHHDFMSHTVQCVILSAVSAVGVDFATSASR